MITERRKRPQELTERVKELKCLLQMARIAAKPGVSIEEILIETIGFLIPAWQYPEITSARIVIDGKTQAAPNFRETTQSQRAHICVGCAERGFIEVVYLEEKPQQCEGPFLEEERNLIDAIAQQVALILERKEAERERAELENQLRHADRLATIGLLAAGVAHELNEPLANILGFAQLARKHPGVAPTVADDLVKIETASLHAREVIKKLLMFARQVPAQKIPVDVNKVVREGLFFFESRCAKVGIDLELDFDPELPMVHADPGQLNQILINLVVNALQAMPDGGALRIRTNVCEGYVCLHVEDSGTGMTSDVLEKVFIPFFTMKDIGQGTGLGLPVVHGIVTSHQGRITINSEPGRGTSVEIKLPCANAADTEGV